jgi:hypothetical protein
MSLAKKCGTCNNYTRRADGAYCLRGKGWAFYNDEACKHYVTKTDTEFTGIEPVDWYLNNCYIATAVYGDYNAPEVIVLRKFRDERLSKSFLGRALNSITALAPHWQGA